MEEMEKNKVEKSTLYLVGTPIGNLSDLSERAKKVLSKVDFIAAEDTRNTAKLLLTLGIKKELVSYHEHNKKSSGEKILARLLGGESCALVTDAGMPAISDPGEDLVRLLANEQINIRVIPGPSAVVCAVALSALSTSKFVFEGFLSANKSERKKSLEALKNEQRTIVFYEAPHKLKATLADMCDTFGRERKISLCREMTKINEEVIRCTIADAITLYEEKEPRGEYVLVVDGSKDADINDEKSSLLSLSPKEHVENYMALGMSKMDAIKTVAKERGVPKSEIYDFMIN